MARLAQLTPLAHNFNLTKESEMSVELRPHTAINVVTKQEQCFQQYLIFEGHPDKMEMVGIVGCAQGSKIIFTVPVDPIRENMIRCEVSNQLEREQEIISCPDIPEDLLHPNESIDDEFNESDFT